MKFAIQIVLMCSLLLPATLLYASDARMQEVEYDPDKIVNIIGKNGIQTMLIFDDDERIENIAVGDSAAWQVTPNKRANRLFVKPTMVNADTNLTVITNRHEYLFQLKTQRGDALPMYSLRFVYPKAPEEPASRGAIEIAESPPPAHPVSVVEKTRVTELNYGWKMKGAKSLFPDRIFDDGQFVYLRWGEDVTPPAIFELQPDGTQSPVNQSVQDGYVVIDHVPPELMLRLGKKKVRLTNAVPPKGVSGDSDDDHRIGRQP